jgi:hypothetical protein
MLMMFEKYVDDESETTDVQLNESGGDDATLTMRC